MPSSAGSGCGTTAWRTPTACVRTTRTAGGLAGSAGSADDPMTSGTGERALQAVAARALDLIGDGARVGLGSGRAAATFIAQLGERVRQGLRGAGVPTSGASGRLARALGIPPSALDEE